MAKAYVLTGTLQDEQTVLLDEALPMASGRFRVTLEPLETEARRPYPEVIAGIRQRQRARGHQPRTREEVDADLSAERERLGDLFLKAFGPTRGVDLELPPREPHEPMDLEQLAT